MTAPIPIISAVVFHQGVCEYLHFSDLSLGVGDVTTLGIIDGSFGASPFFPTSSSSGVGSKASS